MKKELKLNVSLSSFFFLILISLFTLQCGKTQEFYIDGLPIGIVRVNSSKISWNQSGFELFGTEYELHSPGNSNTESERTAHSSFNPYKNFNLFSSFNIHLSHHFNFNFNSEKTSQKNEVNLHSNFNPSRHHQIKLTNGNYFGTGFLIKIEEKAYLVTNFHVACCFKDIHSISFTLHSQFPSLELKIKKIIALSILYDLAVFELDQKIFFNEEFALDTEETTLTNNLELRIIGFPDSTEKPNETVIDGNLISSSSEGSPPSNQAQEICIRPDDSSTANSSYKGASGSPVILIQGAKHIVMGVMWGIAINTTDENVHLRATKIKNLQKLIQSSQTEVSHCEPEECFKRELENLKNYFNNNSSNKKHTFALNRVLIGSGCLSENHESIGYCSSNPYTYATNQLEDNPVTCI